MAPAKQLSARRALASAIFLGLLAGCAAGPQLDQVGLPALPPDKARLYIYRDPTVYDPLVWTAVSLNREVVGSSAPGSVFYRVVAPGTYRIEARSDKLYPGQVKTVVVQPGSTTYVKVEAQPFWGQSGRQWQGNTFVVVAIIDPAIGIYQTSRLQLTPG